MEAACPKPYIFNPITVHLFHVQFCIPVFRLSLSLAFPSAQVTSSNLPWFETVTT